MTAAELVQELAALREGHDLDLYTIRGRKAWAALRQFVGEPVEPLPGFRRGKVAGVDGSFIDCVDNATPAFQSVKKAVDIFYDKMGLLTVVTPPRDLNAAAAAGAPACPKCGGPQYFQAVGPAGGPCQAVNFCPECEGGE